MQPACVTCRWRIARSICGRWAACQGAAVAENRSTMAFQTPQAQGGSSRAPGHLLLSGRWQVRFRRVGRSGPRCAPPCPPDRSRTSLLLLDPNPALTSPSLARSPDLPAEPEAPFGTIAARYFAAHRPHPCAQPSCRTPTHSKKPLVGRSQLLSLMLRDFLRAHFSRVSGQGGAAADVVAVRNPVHAAHQYA